MSMGTVRRCITGAVLVSVAAALAAVGAAGTGATAAKCGNPKLEPLGKALGIRGYLACSDGATAVVKYKGATYRFGSTAATNGVCHKDSSLPLNVDIGAILQGRKKSDPPGFNLIMVKSGTLTTHSGSYKCKRILVVPT